MQENEPHTTASGRVSKKKPFWRSEVHGYIPKRIPKSKSSSPQKHAFLHILLSVTLAMVVGLFYKYEYLSGVSLTLILSIFVNLVALLSLYQRTGNKKQAKRIHEKKEDKADDSQQPDLKGRVRFEYSDQAMRDAQYDVICQDAVQWLNEQTELDGFVVTSMPDYSEVNMPVDQWKEWFTNNAELILRKLPDRSCAIFYQTDVKLLEKKVLDEQDGNRRSECQEWVDKAFLCQTGASRVPKVKLLFHKVMLLSDVGSIKLGRPCYTHMLCFGKNKTDKIEKRPLPDVVDRGDMIYAKAMGLNACLMAAIFCKANGAQKIIDPFCGKGSALLAANLVGLDAVGIDISQGRCRNALSMKKNSLDNFVKSAQQRSFINFVPTDK